MDKQVIVSGRVVCEAGVTMTQNQIKNILYKQTLTAINSGIVTYFDYIYTNGKANKRYRTFNAGRLIASSNIV